MRRRRNIGNHYISFIRIDTSSSTLPLYNANAMLCAIGIVHIKKVKADVGLLDRRTWNAWRTERTRANVSSRTASVGSGSKVAKQSIRYLRAARNLHHHRMIRLVTARLGSRQHRIV